ncbi:MAG: ribonuclease P protein component [bacterium]
MLEKAQRLKNSSEFKTVYNLKRSVANSLLILYVGKKKDNSLIKPRVGFVVAKKIHKRATKRNRVKRLIRESYRNFLRSHPSKDITWQRLIFLARSPMLDAKYEDVLHAVEDCLRKVEKFSNYE